MSAGCPHQVAGVRRDQEEVRHVHPCPGRGMPSSDPRPALTTLCGAHTPSGAPRCATMSRIPRSYESTPTRKRRRRFDDEAPGRSRRPAPDLSALDERLGADPDGPPEGDRWSTWDGAEHGPHPRPGVGGHRARRGRHRAGRDQDRQGGRRPPRRACRAGHRAAHADGGEALPRPPSTGCSTATPATSRGGACAAPARRGPWRTARRSAATSSPGSGRSRSSARSPGCGPTASRCRTRCSCSGTELLLEFVGSDDGTAAPRLAQLRPGRDELSDLWHQLVDALLGLARHGLTHGDLSAYNLLVHDGRLVLIDLPQVVDVIGNPQGPEFLARDVRRVGEWFTARGLPARGWYGGCPARGAAGGGGNAERRRQRHSG